MLTSADQAGAALAGEPRRHALPRRPASAGPTRLLWLAHATEPKGSAHPRRRRRPRRHRAARLAAGRRDHRRRPARFVAGDPVDLADPDGRPVARGLVNFDAEELPALLGRSSHDLKRELGAAYEREVVHRDDLVLL